MTRPATQPHTRQEPDQPEATLSIITTIRELDAAKSRLAEAQRRVSALRAQVDARNAAQADLPGALARHRDALQNADLGIADRKAVEAARAEVHALREGAAKPDVSAELAEAEAELQRVQDEHGAATLSVVRDFGEAALARYRKAAAEAAEAEAQLEGLRVASQDDPYRLGNLVGSLLERKRATYAEAEELRLTTERARTQARDFAGAVISAPTVPALPPGVG